jgi:hypothetical protein
MPPSGSTSATAITTGASRTRHNTPTRITTQPPSTSARNRA